MKQLSIQLVCSDLVGGKDCLSDIEYFTKLFYQCPKILFPGYTSNNELIRQKKWHRFSIIEGIREVVVYMVGFFLLGGLQGMLDKFRVLLNSIKIQKYQR
eukprot:TRINITY_DN18937_c0_g1_i7.p6 TRINITY_DN18937_c0_g1~~TRINITY_DN18937_c0_g1_i7.p6  ORF type:complete len:100 (-),score=3.34 TRINITY_DN18937_c0_g1_i7:446-745(-)